MGNPRFVNDVITGAPRPSGTAPPDLVFPAKRQLHEQSVRMHLPGKPGCNNGLLSINSGLLQGVMAYYVGVLGFPGRSFCNSFHLESKRTPYNANHSSISPKILDPF